MGYNKDYTVKQAEATEHFDFGSSAHDAFASSSKKRNIRNEVTNKGFDPSVIIDAYEQSRGIRTNRTKNELENYKFKNIILDPEKQKDQDMLNELMNNKKYLIVLWKDTWTQQGSYRVFIVYGAKEETIENS
jgi:hypothetical protein